MTQSSGTQVTRTYTAIVGTDDRNQTELVIRQSIPGGVDGPIYDAPIGSSELSLDDIDRQITAAGFGRIEQWAVKGTYAGLTLEAAVTRL